MYRSPSRQPTFRAEKPVRRKHHIRHITYGIIVILLAIGLIKLSGGNASAASGLKIVSGIAGECLDDYTGKLVSNNPVDAWGCNGSSAQSWSVTYDSIEHAGKYCLSVAGNSKNVGAEMVLNTCSNAPGQIWLRDKSGYINPNSGLCLDNSSQLTLESCRELASASETWTPDNYNGKAVGLPSCDGAEGQKIACEAATEWAHWQNSNNHLALLNTYTDNTPYEEWCADFVSYVYKQAGYPLTSAYDGWDENDANNLQNYPEFTEHQASSGYVPKAGDIAWFNYDGGHVEIVVSGGSRPTFVYGNSGQIDPTTGNGNMRTNTLTSDGSEGQLVYYLSPSG